MSRYTGKEFTFKYYVPVDWPLEVNPVQLGQTGYVRPTMA